MRDWLSAWISGLTLSSRKLALRKLHVEPGKIMAFDIQLESRYGDIQELIELLQFAKSVADASIANCVKSALYDSKIGHCSFELDEKLTRDPEMRLAILAVARKTIRSFSWGSDWYIDGELQA